MSEFTNPASAARESGAAYVRAVAALVGDQDPVALLSRTPELIRGSAEGLHADALAAAEAPGRWSVAQVLLHLADAELAWGYRLRRILTEDAPLLRGYDQDRWAEVLGYQEADPGEGLRLFQALRAANLRLLRRASPRDLARTARHEERGEASLGQMIIGWAGHDIVHLRQIERIRQAVGEPRTATPEGSDGRG